MDTDDKIKQETYVAHEGMSDAMREWADEINLENLPEEAQNMLRGIFRDGWSMCLHKTMGPAQDLSMMLLQMVALAKKQGADTKLMLTGQPVEIIEKLCHQIVGMPEDWQLEDIVETVQVGLENPSEDLPEEARETMGKVKKDLAKMKKEN